MKETKVSCDKFDFIDILDVTSRKSVNEHAYFCVKGHIAADSDEYVIRNSAGQTVSFTASAGNGTRKIFKGIIKDISIHTENEMRTLTVNAISKSFLMDVDPETRTFQDAGMTYQTATNKMKEKNTRFHFLWPSDGGKPIGSMMVQYKETDWNFSIRMAGRLGTVVVPDYLLDQPYISIGMPNRGAMPGIDAISYTIKKDMEQYHKHQFSGNFSERDAIYYTVKSREIFDLCDPIPFLNMKLYVYAIDTQYEGGELIHYYTLKEKSGFYTKRLFNEHLIGATLHGEVIEILADTVRVKVKEDIGQTQHKWFPYATPFSQPNGYGWYFMPEKGDEIRLVFPSQNEWDAYVCSAVHISHGNRQDHTTKYIRTIYDQVIEFSPNMILIDNGSGTKVSIDNAHGIIMDTDKAIKIDAESNITMTAFGKVIITGENGIVMQKDSSVVSIDDAIDISSEHTRIQ